jgi:5-methylcytosine-specific restriction endonuclease McrA
MTDKQKDFIWMAFAEKRKYGDIAKILNVEAKTLTVWTKELRTFWKPLAEIKDIHTRKAPETNFNEFYNWYLKLNQNKCCNYCGITEVEISEIKPYTKRSRGSKLELDRKEPNLSYSVVENIVYACYWCNNAKTDTFSSDEFKRVGKVFREIWDERKLKNDK